MHINVMEKPTTVWDCVVSTHKTVKQVHDKVDLEEKSSFYPNSERNLRRETFYFKLWKVYGTGEIF